MNKISIIDYNIGNIGSVIKAFKFIGAEVDSVNTPEQILKSSKLVLPGVSAFGSAMDNLKSLNLIQSIKEFIKSGKPFLGICVGMQILFEESSENPGVSGLGILRGKVERFADSELAVPQMGWNTVSIQKESSLLKGIKTSEYFYFVHSYYCIPESEKNILTLTDYGKNYCSSIAKENISAVQFHPEKSQNGGLKILNNFLEMRL